MNEEIPETQEPETLLSLTKANHELLVANNELLNKMNRREIRQIWFKVAWLLILFGVPFIIYYYFINSFLGGSGESSSQNNINYEMLQEALKLYQGQ